MVQRSEPPIFYFGQIFPGLIFFFFMQRMSTNTSRNLPRVHTRPRWRKADWWRTSCRWKLSTRTARRIIAKSPNTNCSSPTLQKEMHSPSMGRVWFVTLNRWTTRRNADFSWPWWHTTRAPNGPCTQPVWRLQCCRRAPRVGLVSSTVQHRLFNRFLTAMAEKVYKHAKNFVTWSVFDWLVSQSIDWLINRQESHRTVTLLVGVCVDYLIDGEYCSRNNRFVFQHNDRLIFWQESIRNHL